MKNLIALSFALGALVFVAGNVYADDGEVGEIDDGTGSGRKSCMLPCGGVFN